MNRFIVVLAFVMIAGAGTAAPAGATTFCVPGFHSECPDNGTNVSEPDLQTAMNTNADDRKEDRIVLDTRTYVDPDSFTATGTDILWIEGGGSTLTSSSASGTYVADFPGGKTVNLLDLKIVIPASFPDGTGGGARVGHGELMRVDIESRNPGATGFTTAPFGSIEQSHIYGAEGGDLKFGVNTQAGEPGTAQLIGTLVEDAEYAVASDNPDGAINLFSSRLRPSGFGIWSTGGAGVDIQNSLIEAGDEPAVFYREGAGRGVGARMWNSTIVGDDDSARPALDYATEGSPGTSMYALIMDSIIWGFDVPYVLRAPPKRTGESIDLSIQGSNVKRTGGVTKGNVYKEPPVGQTYADPMFARDRFGNYTYRLSPGSPSIDSGTSIVQIETDLAGEPRPVDGNGDGVAWQDQGAFEFQPGRDHRAPKITSAEFVDRRPSRSAPFVRFSLSERSDVRVTLRPVPLKRDGRRRKAFRVTGKFRGPGRVKLRFWPAPGAGRYNLYIRAIDPAENIAYRQLKVRVTKPKR